jgi:uncharacterized membrane protein YjfL (UPF0719 family)
MGLDTVMVGLLFAIIQLIIGLVLALGAVYIGLKMFDKLTEGIDEMEELKKGNAAVAILLGAIILSIANIVEGGVSGITGTFSANLTQTQMMVAFVIGIANLLVSLILAVLAIYLSVNILDKITVGIDEFKELKKGNVAVAIIMAAVLFAVSFVIRASVASMSTYLSPQMLATI